MSIGEVCNRDVVYIEEEASIFKAAQLMRKYHVGNLVVIRRDNGKVYPTAVITDRDIVIEIVAKEVPIEHVLVKDVMSQSLLTTYENENELEVTKSMCNKGVRRVPVINEHQELTGIFAVDDVVDLMAEQLTNLAHLVNNEQRRERDLRS